jgi:hypothetical protein
MKSPSESRRTAAVLKFGIGSSRSPVFRLLLSPARVMRIYPLDYPSIHLYPSDREPGAGTVANLAHCELRARSLFDLAT